MTWMLVGEGEGPLNASMTLGPYRKKATADEMCRRLTEKEKSYKKQAPFRWKVVAVRQEAVA